MNTAVLRRFGTPAVVALVALLPIVLILVLAGYDAPDALGSAFRGSLGSAFAVFSTLKRATPLLLLGISVAVAFRAGVLNIGGEGQFLVGAAAGVAVGLGLPSEMPSILCIGLELLAGVAGGALWAGIAAWSHRRFGVSDVVSTLLLNFIALNLVGYLIRGPMQEPTRSYPNSATLSEAARLPIIVPGQSLHLGFVFAVVVAIVAWWFFRKTAAGFRFTLVGASATVAESAGQVDVARERFRALLLSGAIAGLAGISEAAGVTHLLYENLSPGYGYVAIGVALLGGLHPGGIVAAAILFGALGSGADAMQRDAGVPPELAAVVAAMVILGMLAAPRFSRTAERAPSR